MLRYSILSLLDSHAYTLCLDLFSNHLAVGVAFDVDTKFYQTRLSHSLCLPPIV